MNVMKENGIVGLAAVSNEDLELIHALSRKKLTAEEVYTFAVRLCDNEVDRDWERFPVETLEELAELFVGKSGIFDHQWSARGQTARIYRTELVREDSILTQTGEPYCYLKGYAYMLRTPSNEELIAEIEGGIKREVSVGCAVEKAVCSVCGGDIHSCGHEKGQWYGDRLCWAELSHATDAYEWSFVAVPAQRQAGVLHKGLDPERVRLEKEAAMGRRYLAGLRGEVVRLGALAQPELEHGVLRSIADKLDEEELLRLKDAFGARTQERYPLRTQLPWHGEKQPQVDERDNAFLV